VLSDPLEQRCAHDVASHGRHVVRVDGAPDFAYAVGLMHHVDHPELVMSGLPHELMSAVLERVSSLVLQGFPLQAGQVLEGALARVPVVVDALSDEGLAATVGWSRWFHQREVPAYQLVWPAATGDFIWDSPEQPAAWRVPVERGEPEWTLGAAPGQPVYVCTHVAEDGEPVMRVVRDHQEEWQLLCDADHFEDQRAVVWHLSHCVKTTPSLLALDLQPGHTAWRDAPWLPWETAPL
jgi:hypothetical protein